MPNYRVTDTFATTVPQYWSMFFDPAYNRDLYPALGMDYELLDLRREGSGVDEQIFRRIRLTPRRELPALLRRFINGTITYEERNHFVRASNRVEVETIPNYLADRFLSRGIYSIQATTSGVTRVWDGECECRVPLVGRKIEKFIVDEVRRGYENTTVFTRRWLAAHPAHG
ncbi:MAG: DUF2505 domain-containing protein [Nannocystaceae bacterium]